MYKIIYNPKNKINVLPLSSIACWKFRFKQAKTKSQMKRKEVKRREVNRSEENGQTWFLPKTAIFPKNAKMWIDFFGDLH